MFYVMFMQQSMSQKFAPVVDNATPQANLGGSAKSQGLAGLEGVGKDESMWGTFSKQFKQFTEKVTKGAQKIAFNMGVYGATVDVYARSLVDLFKETYFIEQWIVEVESGDELLLAKLSRISKFLQEVLLVMVMSDLRYLLQRYLKKMCTQALLDMHFKID